MVPENNYNYSLHNCHDIIKFVPKTLWYGIAFCVINRCNSCYLSWRLNHLVRTFRTSCGTKLNLYLLIIHIDVKCSKVVVVC